MTTVFQIDNKSLRNQMLHKNTFIDRNENAKKTFMEDILRHQVKFDEIFIKKDVNFLS